MTIQGPKLATGHPDRDVHCQESIQATMQQILAEANQQGWGTIETITAMEEVLRNLRHAYDEDPDPAEDKAGEGEVDSGASGEFPSTDELVEALDKGRGVP
ncbi:hypothetical protein OIU34_27830 [Pararhizobium sp. BT-229]|uniref:hypothetical protein n=1 Tax=Pararhizobium sp. BT-229 TaxID=2986923 RepID=UPI0021F6EB67|nr:hypothetical protein [Pararhizobium sp. BT-229]MCV9965688.1 hypothetical protein [Pararhizobium sp. BT-229]